MVEDPFHLNRFVDAQAQAYAGALAELKAGRKDNHWIWFIFPQIEGLGFSAMSQRYALSGIAEAQAYLADPVLGMRLRTCVEAMLAHAGQPAEAILGGLDSDKFRSCLTLFDQAAPRDDLFRRALDVFFAGEADQATLDRLA